MMQEFGVERNESGREYGMGSTPAAQHIRPNRKHPSILKIKIFWAQPFNLVRTVTNLQNCILKGPAVYLTVDSATPLHHKTVHHLILCSVK
jgi:hypothetical protein